MARALATGLAIVALASLSACGGGGGGGGGKPLPDRQAIAKLWNELVGSSYGDYAGFCRHVTPRFAAAAAYTGSAPNCARGVEHNRGELPEARLQRLRISGTRATGAFREGTGNLGHVKFAKQGGEWKLDGLTYFVSRPSFLVQRKPQPLSPGRLHTAEGRRIAHAVTTFYAGLENQDAVGICRVVTPTVQRKVMAVGSIQGAKDCPGGYRAIFHQLSFSYTTVPTVVRVTISGSRARAVSKVGRHTLRAPLRKIGGVWKVDSIG